MTTRRQWLITLGAAAIAAGRLRAQDRARVPRIGVLSNASPQPRPPASVEALLEGLRALGYVEGRTIQIEFRWAEGNVQRLPELAADLVRSGVELIVATGDAPTRAARAATSRLPIVMATSGDAVGAGFVSSLARPGGNVTGMTAINPELGAKRLQLLREMLPTASRVAVLWNPVDAAHALELNAVQLAAPQLGVTLLALALRAPADLDKVFIELSRQRMDALIVFNDTTTFEARERILQLAGESRIPAMYEAAEWADAGGLVAYGVTHADLFRRSAEHIDRILKGARPADLPVEQPMRLRLSVNRKTAAALGINVPQSILLRADRMIE